MKCCTSKENWAASIDFDRERSQGSVINWSGLIMWASTQKKKQEKNLVNVPL